MLRGPYREGPVAVLRDAHHSRPSSLLAPPAPLCRAHRHCHCPVPGQGRTAERPRGLGGPTRSRRPLVLCSLHGTLCFLLLPLPPHPHSHSHSHSHKQSVSPLPMYCRCSQLLLVQPPGKPQPAPGKGFHFECACSPRSKHSRAQRQPGRKGCSHSRFGLDSGFRFGTLHT